MTARRSREAINAAFSAFHAVLAAMPENPENGESFDFWNEKLSHAERDLIDAIERPRLQFAAGYFRRKTGAGR